LRLDAHQHFWRYRAQDYPWIDDRHGALRRNFLPDDLKPLLDATGIDGCIAVQARQSESETDDLLALAEQYPWIYGVIGWVDLRATDLEHRLERWSDAPRLRGFRHLIQDEPSPLAFMHDPAFNQSLRVLQRQQKVYEILIKEQDLDATTALCRRHDQHHLLLDHLGKPNVENDNPVAWAERLAPLAALPHVSCKLSGLITEADWQQWHPVQLLPYFYLALELFGPQRLMFGSDWPVCQLAGSYHDVHHLFETAIADLSATEQAAIRGGNAIRLYGLEGICP
jgi:L-fuconolactonase